MGSNAKMNEYQAKIVSGELDPEPYLEAAKHVVREDGTVNWRAAFYADPGCCSCPYCDEIYFILAEVMECGKCQGHFKAWGDERKVKTPETNKRKEN